ncbi:carbohydrate ABC transporter permease [Nesterenkonia xinjiangensis]|uniref:Multiple sugar transport system permease protein n=1 Tax=Nesterenkonia xinjiangensis TaxID=225327 RepID=A0A7Z0GL92_9MICC|nr:sugar ABC transporter permease [Nesterenkonia xinjiangensis]NYJ78077.1 multiple sugar transport system permease protein [Nesterenkonia xinjiangensis]
MSAPTATQSQIHRPDASGEGGPPRQNRTIGDRLTFGRAVPMVPALSLLVLFMAGPILYSLWLAFTDSAIRGEGAAETSFVGFENFTDAFTDSQFWNSVGLTLVFTVVSAVIGQNLLGLFLALLMEKAHRAVTFVITAIVIAAWILPEVVAGYLLYTFFADEGSLNVILESIGLPQQDLLFSLPILAVAFANIWRGTAFSMLVYSAALGSISAEIQESASVDGAGPLRRFWSVTLPLLRPAVATNLMLITLQTLSVFGLIFIMTGGGPAQQSQTLPLYMYEQAFSYGQLGYGTAVALLLLLIGAVASIAYLRLLPEEDKR